MIFAWLLSTIISAWTIFITNGSPLESYSNGAKKSDIQSIVGYVGNSRPCDDLDALSWSSAFHECFMIRKYNDGGRDLNSIVDRILRHSEECASNTKRECRPDFLGFMIVLEKAISQIKDYSEMYLEGIFKDRENIKDLECVEKVLTVKTYNKCFESVFSMEGGNKSEEEFQRGVKDGISCANRANKECSKEVKLYLNKIARIFCGVKEPVEKDVVDETPTPTPEPPMYWYDYIAQPFIKLWNSISSFFSSIFG